MRIMALKHQDQVYTTANVDIIVISIGYSILVLACRLGYSFQPYQGMEHYKSD